MKFVTEIYGKQVDKIVIKHINMIIKSIKHSC